MSNRATVRQRDVARVLSGQSPVPERTARTHACLEGLWEREMIMTPATLPNRTSPMPATVLRGSRSEELILIFVKWK